MTRTDVTELERSRIRNYFSGRVVKPTHAKIIKWYNETYNRKFSRSTISKSLSPKYDYLDDPEAIMKNSRVRTSQWPLLEQTFKVWVSIVEENGGGLTDDNITGKAREIWEEVKEPGQQEPQFSHGWLDRLKQRLGLKIRAVMGEAASVPPEAYEEMKLLREICSEYSSADIFNMDESALYWKEEAQFRITTKSIRGRKPNRQRITFVLCCNAEGSEKCDIFLIGKAKKIIRPRIIKNMDLEKYSCWWHNNANAWMTGELVVLWLTRFYDSINPTRKVILLMDNFSGHAKGVKLCPPPDNIRIEYLPPNSTSLFQPLDQGIIKVVKAAYKRSLAEFRVPRWGSRIDENRTNPSKVITLEDTIKWISSAWFDSLRPVVVQNCYRKSTIFDPPDVESPENSFSSQNETLIVSSAHEPMSLNSMLVDTDRDLRDYESEDADDEFEYFSSRRHFQATSSSADTTMINEQLNFPRYEGDDGDPDDEISGIIDDVRRLHIEHGFDDISDIDEFIESSEDLKCNRESEKAQSFHEANIVAKEFIKEMKEKQARIISDGEVDVEAPSEPISGWIG